MYQLKFGTDGVRARVGTDLFKLTDLAKFGYAFGQWAHSKYGAHPKILLGHDSRRSCYWAKSTIKSGLYLNAVEVHDADILPTPALYALIKNNAYDCGIVISASHNPHQDNGIKIIDAVEGKISSVDEQLIAHYFEKNTPLAYVHFGSEKNRSDLIDAYCTFVCSFFVPHFLKGLKIVLDCSHGATYKVAPFIFEELGATVITINNNPTGYNINENCGSTHPQLLQQAVMVEQADIGFAFDGDGDRIITVNRNGQVKDGDDMLMLLSQHALYRDCASLVGTIMSNQGLEHTLAKNNKNLIRTNVGDKYVAEQLKINSLQIGGEPSGHIICADYSLCGDGIFAALRILETIQQTNNWSMDTFDKFPHFLVNVPVKKKKELSSSPFAEIIQEYANQLVGGRLLVRYSGTEPLLRIMIEHPNDSLAHNTINTLQEIFRKELS